MNYLKIVMESERRGILDVLSQDESGYRANADILQKALQMAGYKVPYDRVKAHLTWLSQQGLITLEYLGKLAIASLTKLGLDTAQGNNTVPGIALPEPE